MATLTKAFTYLRVSGPGQLRGDGFERQRQACQTYARSNHIHIVEEFCEKAVPGATELDQRPALLAMLEALVSDGVKLVLIEKLDRLARDLMVQETIIADLRKRGYQLVSTSEPDLLSNDASRILMRQIFGAIAQYDKAMVVAKLRGARERKRARGERCEGQRPWGQNEQERKALHRMLELRREKLSYEAVAAQMNQEGIPTRAHGVWHAMAVHRIIKRTSTVQAK